MTKSNQVSQFPFIFLTILSFFLMLMPAGNIQADIAHDMSECSKITDNNVKRLECFDDVANRYPLPISKQNSLVQKKDVSQPKSSYLTKLWDLDKKDRNKPYSLKDHRSSYVLPYSYNNMPNTDPFQDRSSDETVKESEFKFQLSLKAKLWQDILDKDFDLWLGYTQKSFWQLYNPDDSSPFRETNYEPELLVNFRTDFDIPGLGLKCRMINVGFNHQSNGRSVPYSRSWNRIVSTIGLEKENFTLLLKPWYRLPEGSKNDDNPDIDDYLGYGEIWGYLTLGKHRLGAMLRNNLQTNDNRGALQLEWSIPLLEKINFYIQYFTGYGESLLDYNHSVNRIGIGFNLVDWD